MQILIDLDEARLRDVQRIAKVQLERNNFRTAEQIIAKGTPLPKAENHGFIAVCDSLGAVTQEVANKLKNTVFVGDEDCSYCFDIMEIIKADGGDAE